MQVPLNGDLSQTLRQLEGWLGVYFATVTEQWYTLEKIQKESEFRANYRDTIVRETAIVIKKVLVEDRYRRGEMDPL